MTILYESLPQYAQHLVLLLGTDTVHVSTVDGLERAVAAAPGEPLVVCGPSVPLSEVVAFAAGQRLARPALGVVLLRQHLDLTVLAEALRAGVREVADLNDPPGVLAACARSVELSRQLQGASVPVAPQRIPAEPERDAKVITVFAAKGGCGKTVLATNLAVALAAGGARRVCLIDLDLAFGDVAIMLQLNPDKTIAELIPAGDRVDETGLRTTLTPYVPGVDTLLAPVQPEVAESVGRDLVAELIYLARGMFDYVIVDTPPHFNETVLAALDASHVYVLVATPELPALKNLRVTLDMFDMLDYRRENRVIVLNRADAKVGLSGTDIERVVRAPIASLVPSSRDVPVTVNRGVPIVLDQPGHPVSAAIRELAKGRLAGDTEDRTGRIRGILSRRAKR
jgi:pilus assembly protein CpaE